MRNVYHIILATIFIFFISKNTIFSYQTPIRYDFEGTTHNWTNAKDDGWGSTWWGITAQTYSTDYSYTGSYSLKCTADFNSGTTDGGYVFIKESNLPTTPPTLFDNCPTKLYVYLPSGAPTNLQARIYIQNSNWSDVLGPWVTLTPGSWTEVSFTPTDTNVPYRRFGVHIQGTTSTSWSGYIYVDSVRWVQWDFENTTQNWTNSSGWGSADAGITGQSSSTDYSFTGSYSLRGTCNFNSTNYKGALYIENTAYTPTNDTQTTIRVLMPSGGPTGYTAKIFIQDNGWGWYNSSDFTLIPGQWVTLSWTTPSGLSTPYIRYGVQIIWNGSSNYTGYIYVDAGCWPDITAPGEITTLSGQPGTNSGEIKLSWLTPGDNEYTGTLPSGSQYKIQYSTASNGTGGGKSGWSYNNAQITISTSNVPVGTLVGYVITGLTGGVTYYIKIWTADEVPNWSNMSNTATTWAQVGDTTPPGAITTLSAEPGPVPESVKLSWLTPGDNGYTGTLPSGSQYKIQYSTASNGTGGGKSGWSYNNAQITISTSNVPVGTLVGYVITGLTGGVTYYIKIWTADEVPNWSNMSNTATTWAQVGDTTPPGAITTLSAEPGPVPESVKLSWLTPGDNEYTGTLPSGSQYKIQYSTASNGTGGGKSGWSYNNAQITISTSNVPVGTLVGYVITGLTGGVTYYIKIWTADEVPNWSNMSNTATTWAQVGDTTPPGAITTLSAEPGPVPESVKLSWLTPGDNGYTGTLPSGSQYKIQYATYSNTTWDKNYAQVTISTSDVSPGTQVSYVITGLAERVTFYFRIWTADEVPNWSDLSNIATAYAAFDLTYGSSISIPSTVMVVYSEGSNGVRYRTLTPGSTVWSDEQAVPPISSGAIYWAKIVACPVRDEKLLITLDSSGNLCVSTYSDAGGWANSAFILRNDLTNSPATVRWFDICYEQVSGDAMVVYSTGSNVLAYRTFNGTTWSQQMSVGNLIDGADRYPYWVSISPKPNSDEILLVYSGDQVRKVYASVWNGSSWGNHTIVYNGDVNNDSYRCSIAATYEWSSGYGVVIHANTSLQIVAKKWNGTQWLDSVSGSAGTIPQFLVLKPRLNSNEIMVFYGNSSGYTFAIKWTGSTWSSYQQIDNEGGGIHAYPISGEAETATGHEGHWISLSNQASSGLRSDHYDGTSWTIVQQPVHNTGDLGEYKSVMTTSLPGCTTVYALANRGNYLESLFWIPERSTWTALVQLENNLQSGNPNSYISFWMTPNSELIEMVYKVVPDSVPPAAVSDLKVSLGEVNGQDVFFATWTAPGDNGNEYKLHQPSQFRIQYSTNPDTTWDKNLAQVVIPIDIWGIDPGVKVSTIIIPSQIVEGATYYFYLWTADEVPNWSQKSNQAYVYVPKTLAYVVYYDSSTSATPKFRKIKEDGSISAEFSMPSVDNPSGEGVAGFYRIAACPKRNELISVMVSADANNTTRLWTYRFNGSSWTKYSPYGSETGPSISRGVADVAYEQDSGKALVVYARGSGSSAANVLRYVVWNGTSWGSESAATSDLGSEIYWVKLYPKPQTNEIVAVVQLQNNTIRSFVWDGNSWSDGVNLQSAASSSDYQCFDAVYESQRKKFILVCSSGTANGTVQYTIWDSTSWSSPQYFIFGTSDNPLSANPISWIKLACKPAESNEVLMVVSDGYTSQPNIGAAVWNGTSWTQNTSPLTSNAAGISTRRIDVSYEQQSAKGFIAYRDYNYSNVARYITYTTGSGWSSPASSSDIGNNIRWLSLAADYGSNNILLVCSDFSSSTPDLSLQIWDGSSWSSNNKIETEMSERESFAVTYRKDLYAVFDKTPPAAVTDLTGEVLGEGVVKLIWSTAGDDGWSGMLPCGSRILFVFSTATPTTSELTWPATFSLIISTYGISSPQKQSYIISNLPYETTWYFKLRTRDEAGNWSELSNACTLYVVVNPAAITSLSALPSRWGRCIELSWISPGDDGWTGNIEGGLYRIRYSTYVTSDSDFWTTGTWNDFKNKFEIIWSTNTPPLQQQRRRLTGLLPGVTYYIRIWTRDENPDNWSTISNAATSWAQIVVVGIYVTGYAELSWSTTYNFDWLKTNTSSITSYGLLIRNDGNVYEDYGLKIDTITMAEVYKTEWKIDNSSVVKNNIFVLEYIFYNLPPPTTYFGTAYNSGTDDVITDTIIWSAEGTKYHPPSEINQPENTKGIRVIPFEDNVDDLRKGWFMIRTPLATSTTEQQVIPVQFWAQENENIGPSP
jgi:hypothetical protein